MIKSQGTNRKVSENASDIEANGVKINLYGKDKVMKAKHVAHVVFGFKQQDQMQSSAMHFGPNYDENGGSIFVIDE